MNDEKILDRTGQNIGDIESEIEYLDPNLLEVDYTNTRLKKLPPMNNLVKLRVYYFKNKRNLQFFKSLNLRQNLLEHTALQDLKYLTSLTNLDLYDNKLSSAEIGFENCVNLEYKTYF